MHLESDTDSTRTRKSPRFHLSVLIQYFLYAQDANLLATRQNVEYNHFGSSSTLPPYSRLIKFPSRTYHHVNRTDQMNTPGIAQEEDPVEQEGGHLAVGCLPRAFSQFHQGRHREPTLQRWVPCTGHDGNQKGRKLS